MTSTMVVAAAQISPRLGDLNANLEIYREHLRAARAGGVDLLVFPELSLTGYFLKDMVSTVALRLDSPEINELRALSRGTAFVAGLVEETPDFRFYNSAVYFEEGEIRHVHRKVYLPTYGLFDEGRYFARGDCIRSFESKFGRLALLICEDLWHPSTVYISALDHAVIIICPSTSPLRGITDGAVQDDNARYWEALNRTYAQMFSLFVVYANRVGFEDGVGFWGGSEIIDPSGQTLAKGRYYEPDLVTAELNFKRARQRRVVAPMLRDEDLDLTINELLRIRGRTPEGAATAPAKRSAPIATKSQRRVAGRRAAK
ncbi:MAG TPA: nitrilase-related carbon-nitrogen hydrolase [Candidatus Binatia bacterium]|nr:nitrilase-related carbon-nitrogen hydrolase [Candidatus Binatia bacterium]